MTDTPTPLHPQGSSRIIPTAKLLGIHQHTLRRWWNAGKFPKPIYLNGLPVFKNADILAWLDGQGG